MEITHVRWLSVLGGNTHVGGFQSEETVMGGNRRVYIHMPGFGIAGGINRDVCTHCRVKLIADHVERSDNMPHYMQHNGGNSIRYIQ